VVRLLPPGWKPARSPFVQHLYSLRVGGAGSGRVRRYGLLYYGTLRRARTLDVEALYAQLAAELRQNLAARAPRHVFVHAGVVGWKGRALLVPGASFAGKTTLVEALVRRGATYYSDEFAVLDGRGRVHPFAKPLSVRDATGRAALRPAAAYGASEGTRPLRVGLVALTHFRGGRRFRPVPLTPGQGLLAMLPHTVPVRKRPEQALSALERALAGVPVVKGPRGEAEETADALLALLDARTRPARPARRVAAVA